MGEQNRRAVEAGPAAAAVPVARPNPDLTMPHPGSREAEALAETRDERQTRRMAPDNASPGEAADE